MRYINTLHLILLVSFTGCSTGEVGTPTAAKADAPGLSAATAVFDEYNITIAIPMDVATWGSAVEVDETAGYAARLAQMNADARLFENSSEKSVETQAVPKPEPGAFGLMMQLNDPEPQTIDFIIWPKEVLESDKFLLLECFIEPVHHLYGEPRTWRAKLLQDQVRRARLGNIAIGTAADQETIIISDSSLLFEDFIKHQPKEIEIYITLKRSGIQRAKIPVQYRVDVSKAKVAPSLH